MDRPGVVLNLKLFFFKSYERNNEIYRRRGRRTRRLRFRRFPVAENVIFFTPRAGLSRWKNTHIYIVLIWHANSISTGNQKNLHRGWDAVRTTHAHIFIGGCSHGKSIDGSTSLAERKKRVYSLDRAAESRPSTHRPRSFGRIAALTIRKQLCVSSIRFWSRVCRVADVPWNAF